MNKNPGTIRFISGLAITLVATGLLDTSIFWALITASVGIGLLVDGKNALIRDSE